MRVLVWGGSGFLGSHIADALSKRGHDVTIADIKKSSWLSGEQKFLHVDVRDRESVNDATKGMDAVFNFSGIADISDADLNPNRTVEINILGNLNILEAVAAYRVQKYVFASTLYVFSKSGGYYRVSKQACESYIEEFSNQNGLNYLILRYGSVYGPRSGEHNSIYRFVSSALKSRSINYWGKPDSLREYIHVDDATEGSVKLFEGETQSGSFILSGSETLKVSDVMAMIQEILGYELELSYDELSDSGHYDKTPYSFAPRYAKKYTANYQIDLGQGLLAMIEEISAETQVKENQS